MCSFINKVAQAHTREYDINNCLIIWTTDLSKHIVKKELAPKKSTPKVIRSKLIIKI